LGKQILKNLNEEASWDVAREYASAIGKLPPVFSAALRLLVKDHFKHGGELRPVTKFLVGQALRGKKILSMLYYSAERFKPQQLANRTNISLGELVNLFSAYDLAVLYGLFLTYRRVIKVQQASKFDAGDLLSNLRVETQLGGIVGTAVPKIGLGNGLLAGTLHHLAIATVNATRPSCVSNYYRNLGAAGKRWNLYDEVDIFGCTSLQIGAALMSKVGFNKATVEIYLGALDPELRLGNSASGELYPIKYGRLWIDGLLSGQEQPIEKMPGEFYPLLESRIWMETQNRSLNPEVPSWIERSDKDVSEELTPMLFANDKSNQDVPEQLQDIFTLKEISTMDENEFDELVDQIDKEIQEGTFGKGAGNNL